MYISIHYINDTYRKLLTGMTKTTYIKAVLNGIRKGVSELPGDMIVRLVVQPVQNLHTHTHTHKPNLLHMNNNYRY